MDTIFPTPIQELKPYGRVAKIKVRICRIWKPDIPGMDGKSMGLHCILVDDMQDAIEACSTEMDHEVLALKVQAGNCYEITNFRINRRKAEYRVVPNDSQIVFTLKTVFKKITNEFPPIPRHRFFLQDYNMLYPRLDRVDILTDVVGHVKGMQHLEPKQVNERVVHKCDIVLENLRKEEAKLTLWGDVAKNFSSLSLEALALPVIAVFTSLKVKLYRDNVILNSTGSSLFFIDPNITEINSYKSVFSSLADSLRILPSSSNEVNEAEILQTAKKMTIDQLGFLDPDLHKDDTFLCEASVKRFDTRHNWWYSACPTCVKQMHKDPTGQLTCHKHPNQIPTPWYKVTLVLQDETDEISALIIGKCGEKLFGTSCKNLVFNQRLADQQQLPNEFLRLIGQKKTFHLRFSKLKNYMNSNDLLIHNVSEDVSMQPTTPLPLFRQAAMSSTTVSSSTSTPDASAQSYKRKRESVSRSLFIDAKKIDMEEISEASVQDFDEIPIKLLKRPSPTGSGKNISPPKKY